jgi:hypothetical protein
MTTNCIMDPLPTYAANLFTTGEVGVADATHLPTKDFSPVIARALELPGFTYEPPEEQAQYVTVGFGHEATLGAAGAVLEAIQDKQLRHIFLIGGWWRINKGEGKVQKGCGGLSLLVLLRPLSVCPFMAVLCTRPLSVCPFMAVLCTHQRLCCCHPAIATHRTTLTQPLPSLPFCLLPSFPSYPGGCDAPEPSRKYYTEVAAALPKDTMVLTLGCGKYRFYDQDFGTLPNGLPRLLDMGQVRRGGVGEAQTQLTGIQDFGCRLHVAWTTPVCLHASSAWIPLSSC